MAALKYISFSLVGGRWNEVIAEFIMGNGLYVLPGITGRFQYLLNK
jgi:hypothetical protein